MDHSATLPDPTKMPRFMPASAEDPIPEEPQTFLTLRLGGQYFALSVAPVREILDEQPVASLPEPPADVIGMIDVRGESVIIMDISRRLGVLHELQENRRIVVLERAAVFGRPVGVLADQVLNVVEIPQPEIEEAPRLHGEGAAQRLTRGIARLGGRLVLVLDHEALIGGSADDLFDFAG